MSLTPGPADPPGTSRSTSATIQPNILRCLVGVAHERGIDLRPVLKQVGLDETIMRSAALRVSYRQGSAVIRRAVELTGDERLGLKVGAAQHLTAWGLLGFALMADDTLRHAIGTGVRYQNLSGAMVVGPSRRHPRRRRVPLLPPRKLRVGRGNGRDLGLAG